MLYRKIEKDIEGYLRAEDDRIMILEGARQIGKTNAIRYFTIFKKKKKKIKNNGILT